MVAPIGNLVSECFYGGQLQSVRNDLDLHLRRVIPQPVTWFTTTKLPNHREHFSDPSYINLCEAEVILQILKRLNWVAENAQKTYSVAVLTGYAAQRGLIERKLAPELSGWRDTLTVECNTVDAFQGREADIVLYSVTRSNDANKMGFIRQVERLNVALSRGRIGLVIVGDHSFCRMVGDNPSREVLDYIERHPQDCILMEPEL